MDGLALTVPALLNKTPDGSLWSIPFPTKLNVISKCSGATRLAFKYLYNLLSSFNPSTGCGSSFRALIASAIISEEDTAYTTTFVASELFRLEERFLAFQAIDTQDVPDNEKLKQAEIIKISVVDTSVQILIKLTTVAGTIAYVEV
jgi:hypothetical protein